MFPWSPPATQQTTRKVSWQEMSSWDGGEAQSPTMACGCAGREGAHLGVHVVLRRRLQLSGVGADVDVLLLEPQKRLVHRVPPAAEPRAHSTVLGGGARVHSPAALTTTNAPPPPATRHVSETARWRGRGGVRVKRTGESLGEYDSSRGARRTVLRNQSPTSGDAPVSQFISWSLLSPSWTTECNGSRSAGGVFCKDPDTSLLRPACICSYGAALA